MRRSITVLGVDVIVSLIALAWCWWGAWFGLLGFSVYHSRGDVWLPTPPVAREFFQAMVMTGTVFFVALFVLVSVVIFLVRRYSGASDERSGSFLSTAFYGDNRRLYMKYAAFLFVAFISPYFYRFMRRVQLRPLMLLLNAPEARMFRICGGFAITFAAFVVAVAATDWLIARPARAEPKTI